MFYYSNKPRSAPGTGRKNGRNNNDLIARLEEANAEAGTAETVKEYARVLYKTLAGLVETMEKSQGGDPDGSIMANMRSIYGKLQSFTSEEVRGERNSPSSSITTTMSISSNKNKVSSSSGTKRTNSYTSPKSTKKQDSAWVRSGRTIQIKRIKM